MDPLEIIDDRKLCNSGTLLVRHFDLPCSVRWRRVLERKKSCYVHNVFCQREIFRIWYREHRAVLRLLQSNEYTKWFSCKSCHGRVLFIHVYYRYHSLRRDSIARYTWLSLLRCSFSSMGVRALKLLFRSLEAPMEIT